MSMTCRHIADHDLLQTQDQLVYGFVYPIGGGNPTIQGFETVGP